jgi:CopG family nickel-responsive transcriptional regulator
MSTMPGVRRFGVSMEPDLVLALDGIAKAAGLPNRSDAIRALVRERASGAPGGAHAVGTLSLVYDHDRREVSRHLTSLQHAHANRIVASVHVHLDPQRCLEVLVLRGPAARIREISDRLIGTRGVEQGRLTWTAVAGCKGHRHA